VDSRNLLKDRVIVITGGARDAGWAYTNAFLAAGARVVSIDLSWAGVELPAAEAARNLITVNMDVTRDGEIDKAYLAAVDRFGTVDALINYAAMRQPDVLRPTDRITTLETKDSDWEKCFAVNVFGVLKVTRRFIRPMMNKKCGSVVNIVSSGILLHSRGGAYTTLRPDGGVPYQSSKAALATMSFYLADEIKERNVAVNVVIPDHTLTTGLDDQTSVRLALVDRPGPSPVVPDQTVPLVMHLAAQDASSMTGKMFDVREWNIEQGRCGNEPWTDRAFSYESPMPR
jgi:NAD(P)-dependent dehydrogenase (short-subunit alcohol dehydrogenase family)